MPTGYSRSLSTLNNWRTIGFDFKPIPNVVIKVDYMKNTNEAIPGWTSLMWPLATVSKKR
ncbi:MAG: hypothetical protein CM1200mP25_0380 [Acidobacteriota bacterium]|nr:MAG: hypothetical protein CM1200mP25_0380 [Acidobacteriota bacterium]